jgi:cytochrome c-type biogenesis protein CcmH/NrfG
MENQTPAATVEWTSTKVYILGVICLVLGIALGALFHGPAQPASASAANPTSDQQVPPQAPAGNPHAGLPNMTKDPAIEKLKTDPNNFDLLVQAGNAEMKSGDPKSAVVYYGRALGVKDDPDVRTNLANAYFRSGDADRSLAELATVLKADPKNDKALFNTGVVQLMAKNDQKGAIASWETLLKYYPNHPHKAQVLEMIKRAKSAGKAQG